MLPMKSCGVGNAGRLRLSSHCSSEKGGFNLRTMPVDLGEKLNDRYVTRNNLDKIHGFCVASF